MFNNAEWVQFRRVGLVILIILGLFLVASTLYVFRSYASIDDRTPPTNVITVTGEGETFAIPDIATFSFGVQDTQKTVAEAQKKVTEKINKAIDYLKGAGIDEKDIRTTDYSIYPRYEYQNQVCTSFSCPPSRQILLGYEVSQMITVKVRKVEDAGNILGGLGSMEVTNVSGIQFTIDDETKLQNDARLDAISDAKSKAGMLARDLGVRLGRIVSFSETGNYPMPYMKYEMAADGRGGAQVNAPAPQVPAGENKIVSNVTITYEIR